MFTQEERF